MSVDTTILILKTKKGYHVATIQAAENITLYRNKSDVKSYFSNASLVQTLEEAYDIANSLESEHVKLVGYPSEYGIRLYEYNCEIK